MTNNYYRKHKERRRKEARERYQYLSAEENDKRRKKVQEISKFDWIRKREKVSQYHSERNKNLSEDQKQMLFEYRRNYYITP